MKRILLLAAGLTLLAVAEPMNRLKLPQAPGEGPRPPRRASPRCRVIDNLQVAPKPQ